MGQVNSRKRMISVFSYSLLAIFILSLTAPTMSAAENLGLQNTVTAPTQKVILPKATTEHPFTGRWIGTGTYLNDKMLQPVEAHFELIMVQTEDKISLRDCWAYLDPVKGTRSDCYNSEYSVNGSSQIYRKGKKIGDIFPWQVIIYQGNTQVSEFMKFAINGQREIKLNYSYANFDGQMSVRVAQLKEVR